MRPFVSLAAVAALLATAAPLRADEAPSASRPAATVRVPSFANATCPIMGKPSSKALYVDTSYGRIYVCCTPCLPKVLADPARAHATAYPVVKPVANTVDPVTGAAIGATPVLLTLQGHEIRLATEASVAPARANAQVTLTKALDPRVVDVRNPIDPVTGTPVVADAFVLIDDDLVHLSSPKVVEVVRKDPETVRRVARELAAKAAATPTNSTSAAPAR